MNRREVLTAAAALPLAIGSLGRAQAQTMPVFRYAYSADPLYDAAFWAFKNGKVTSDQIKLEILGLSVPEVIQATSTGQFDVVQTAVMGLPAAAERGLELKIVSKGIQCRDQGAGNSIYVRSDSPIEHPQDLKGKTLASYGLRSTAFLIPRLTLRQKYGLNTSVEGGDVRMVEMPVTNMPAALVTGNVDAAAIIYAQAYLAEQSDDFRVLVESGKDFLEIFGFPLMSSVNVSYPDKLNEYPERFHEFNRLMRASLDYALSNRDEVFNDVASVYNIPPGYFSWLFDSVYDIAPTLTEREEATVQQVWELARSEDIIKSAPEVAPFVWEGVERS